MLEIRPETAGDREAVFAVERAAFGHPNEAELVDTLRESAHPKLSLVASLEDRVVGHVFFSPVTLDAATDVAAAALGPLAVAPAHQGQDIGGALVRAGLAGCAELGWRAVFLVGNPAYYERFGFERAAARDLVYGLPQFEPAFQLVELEPDALAGCSGRVRFHPAFAEAEGP